MAAPARFAAWSRVPHSPVEADVWSRLLGGRGMMSRPEVLGEPGRCAMDADVKSGTEQSSRRVLLVVIILSLICAPISWVDDGVTPSFVVYPIVLLVALWRVLRGGGALFVGIAALVFLLVHLPWTWAALTGADSNPLDRESPSSPVQWLVTLFAVPLLTTVAGWLIWFRDRYHRQAQL